jgi:hypothetical protein
MSKNPARESALLKYIGSRDVHDASVVRVDLSEENLDVILQVKGTQRFRIRNVQHVESNRPEGMMLYAVAELRAAESTRHFSFINWDEKDDARLEIAATDYEIDKI